MKKILNIIIVSVIFVIFILNNNCYGYDRATYGNGIESFPIEYRPYLQDVKNRHPNWNFVSVNTNMDYDHVIMKETYQDLSRGNGRWGVSLVPSWRSNEWKYLDGNGNPLNIEPGWQTSSITGVQYIMDPRINFTDERIFQFERTVNNTSSHTKNVVDQMLKNCNIGKAPYNTRQYKSDGYIEMGKSYSDIIMNAGRAYSVSPVHLASRIVQETGGDNTASRVLNGKFPGYENYYNFFNIGASCGDGCGNPAKHGMMYAKNKGWDTPEKAIMAAAKKLNDGYIAYGQDNVYFEKFDVHFNIKGVKPFYTQYMTNIFAPRTEAGLMYNAYLNAGVIASNNDKSAFTFYIPVYNKMTSDPVAIDGVYVTHNKVNSINFDKSNLNLGINGVAKLNLNFTPNDAWYKEYNIVSNNTNVVTVDLAGNVVAKGPGNTTIVATSLDQNKTAVCSVTVSSAVTNIKLDSNTYTVINGEYLTISPIIEPNNAVNKNYSISSNNSNVVIENNKIKGANVGSSVITFKTEDGNKTVNATINVIDKGSNSIKINDLVLTKDEITNVDLNNNTVEYLLNKIVTNLKVEVRDINNNIITGKNKIGTGTQVIYMDSNNNIISKHVVIIYGDISGDGNIDSLDILKLRQKLLGVINFKDIESKAGNISKDTTNIIDSLDLLKLRQHLLNVIKIGQ